MKTIYSKEHNIKYLGLVPSEEGHTLLTGGSRIAGKSVSLRGLIEKLKKMGFIIIELGDPKNEMEGAYVNFFAKNYKQRKQLKKIGLKPKKYGLKMYSVLTNNLTKRKIPETKFYTVSLKDLGESELKFIFDNPEGTSEIDTCINAIKSIDTKANEEDFWKSLGYQMLRKKYSSNDETKTELKEHDVFIDNEKTHFLNLKTSQRRELDSIFKKFGIFRNEGIMLMPNNYKLNMDMKTILQDNKNYHFFHTKYLRSKPAESRKIRSFLKLHLFLKIINNLEYAKHPLFIFWDELRLDASKSASKREGGYKKVVVDVLSDELSACGGKGKGVIIGATSQLYSGLHPDVADTFTSVFLGKVGASHTEMKKIIETYNKGISEDLIGLNQNEFVRVLKSKTTGKIYGERVILPPPSHAIAEREDNFMELWKKTYPKKLKSYEDLVDEINNLRKEWIKKRKEEIKLMIERRKEKERKKLLEEAKKTQEVYKDVRKEKVKASKQKQDMIIKEIDEQLEKGEVNYSQIAKKYEVHSSYPSLLYKRKKKVEDSIVNDTQEES